MARQAHGGQADQGQQEEDRGGHRQAVRGGLVDGEDWKNNSSGAGADDEGGSNDDSLGKREPNGLFAERARPDPCRLGCDDLKDWAAWPLQPLMAEWIRHGVPLLEQARIAGNPGSGR